MEGEFQKFGKLTQDRLIQSVLGLVLVSQQRLADLGEDVGQAEGDEQGIKVTATIPFLMFRWHRSAPSAMLLSVADALYSSMPTILAYVDRIGPNCSLFCDVEIMQAATRVERRIVVSNGP